MFQLTPRILQDYVVIQHPKCTISYSSASHHYINIFSFHKCNCGTPKLACSPELGSFRGHWRAISYYRDVNIGAARRIRVAISLGSAFHRRPNHGTITIPNIIQRSSNKPNANQRSNHVPACSMAFACGASRLNRT